jgi:hypothetical protein
MLWVSKARTKHLDDACTLPSIVESYYSASLALNMLQRQSWVLLFLPLSISRHLHSWDIVRIPKSNYPAAYQHTSVQLKSHGVTCNKSVCLKVCLWHTELFANHAGINFEKRFIAYSQPLPLGRDPIYSGQMPSTFENRVKNIIYMDCWAKASERRHDTTTAEAHH